MGVVAGIGNGVTAPAGQVVGRVGALAMALGIGAAVLAMPGLAAADNRGSGGASGSADSSDSSSPSSSSSSSGGGYRGPHRAAASTQAEPGAALTAGVVTSAPQSRGRWAPGAGDVAAPGSVPEGAVPVAVPEGAVSVAVVPAPAAAQHPGVARVGRGGAGTGGAALPAAATAQTVPVLGAAGVSQPAASVGSAGSAGLVPSASQAPASGQAPGALSVVGPASVAAPVSGGSGTAAPSVFATAAPKATAAVPGWIQKIDDLNQSAVRTIFNGLVNWASTLPVTSVTTWLEGGLLMVRKSLFNQTASVSAYQSVNHPELVTGKIDVIDPEGDAYTIGVSGGPSHGTVTLAPTDQANGIGTTKYTYIPGSGYTGADQFVVKVSPTTPTFNLLHPFGALNDRYYTVAVGDAAVSATALGSSAKDTLDTSLFMDHAGATVTVKKQGLLFPTYTAAVTLSAASAARAFDWMDIRGRTGSVSTEAMLTQDWSAYTAKAAENGVKPMLVFNYADAEGADTAVLVDVAKVAKNTDGSYTFTGHLSSDAPAQEGPVDTWDYTGIDYKRAYENFLSASGLKDCKSGAVCTTVSAVGILGATTLSPSSFSQDGGHDYPLPKLPTPGDASATQTYPGAMGPGTTSGNGNAIYGNTNSGDTLLTAMIPWGAQGSFITATNLAQTSTTNNGIYLYTANSPAGAAPTWAPAQLIGNGWNAAVNVMAEYDQVVTDANGNPIPVSFTGSASNSATYTLTGSISAPGTTPAAFTGNISGSTLDVTGVTSGTINTGDYVVGGPANNTYITSFGTGTGGIGTYSVSPYQTWPSGGQTGSMTSGQGGSTLQITLPSNAEFDPASLVGQSVSGPDVAPGTVITGYTGQSGSTATYTVNTYDLVAPEPLTVTVAGNLLTLSLANAIDAASLIGQTITGTGIPDNTVITGFVTQDSSTVTLTINNAASVPTGSTITTPNIYQQQPGLVVALSDGSVQYWNGGGCSQTAQGCDGSVQSQGVGSGWTQLQPSGANGFGFATGAAANTLAMLPDGQGFAVGLSDGSVYGWQSHILPDGTIVPGTGTSSSCSSSNVGSCWIQLHDNGWGSGVSAMIPSGQSGLIVGLSDGSVEQWNGSGWMQLHDNGWGSAVQTLLPYDQTTLVGAITGAVVVADTTTGVISQPSYAATLQADSAVLAASTSNCQSSYDSGSGTGCGGYVLTVQQVAGNPITVGQTLYGGAGLASGTTIVQQVSDDAGNLCSDSCAEGGAGVYLVNTSQLVAPGTPMSASDGTGFIVGLASGSVQQYKPDTAQWEQLQGTEWETAVNTMIPWRDGFAVSLANGATFYWSPSNNPGNNNPNNSNALNYAGSTVTSQNTQGSGWSQLHDTGWGNPATAMVPVGDGFALGLGTQSGKYNGATELFIGFGSSSSSTTSAFGFEPGSNGPQAITATNGFTQIASQNALSGDSQWGTVQQMIPITGYVTDSAGNVVQGVTLVEGLTNNGIYAWQGGNIDTSTTTWTTLQSPGTGGKPVLTKTQLANAWTYGNATSSNTGWGDSGGVGATYVSANGSTPASGDPVFGLSTNQAWCGTGCNSHGDYSPLVFNQQFGNDGVIYSWGIGGTNNNDVVTDVNLSSVTYGYVFYPNGFIDKFRPSKYSVGMLAAFQGGPSVTVNNTTATYTQSFTGPQTGSYDATPVGTFAVNVGFNAAMNETVGLTNVTNPVAYAYYIPGLLYTWNVNGDRHTSSLSFNWYDDVGYDSNIGGTASITPTVTPYIETTYGLFTPPSTPIIGEWSVFDLGLGYQNPVSFTLTGTVNPDDVSMSVTSQGFMTTKAGFLPNMTKLLSWSDKFQVYSVTDQLYSASV